MVLVDPFSILTILLTFSPNQSSVGPESEVSSVKIVIIFKTIIMKISNVLLSGVRSVPLTGVGSRDLT